MKSIGRKLVELRGCKSQREVADSIGITVTALSNYENDARVPRDTIKIKLANYYKSSVECIFFEQKVHSKCTKDTA